MESIGYVAMYFLRGKLPWQGLKARNMEEKYERIKIKKVNTDPFELCEGYPIEFGIYINHCRNALMKNQPTRICATCSENYSIAKAIGSTIVMIGLWNNKKGKRGRRKRRKQKKNGSKNNKSRTKANFDMRLCLNHVSVNIKAAISCALLQHQT